MRLFKIIFKEHPTYNTKEVVFSDEKGDYDSNHITIVIGPNGTGKSTLLREITRIFRDLKSSGKITYRHGSLNFKYDMEFQACGCKVAVTKDIIGIGMQKMQP